MAGACMFQELGRWSKEIFEGATFPGRQCRMQNSQHLARFPEHNLLHIVGEFEGQA